MSSLIFGAVVASFLVGLFLSINGMIYFLFFYVAVSGMLKILSSYNPFVHVGADIFAGLIYLRILVASATKTGSRERIPPLSALFALHFAWFLVTFLNPYQLGIIASLAGIKLYVTMVLLYFVGFTYTTSFTRVRSFMTVWVIILFLQTALSTYQAAIGPTSVTQLHPGYAYQLSKFIGYAFRPFGFTQVPGAPAVYVFLVNPFVLYFLFESKKMLTVVLMLGLAVISWLTLFVCQVRSAILKTVLSTGLFFGFYIREYLRYFLRRPNNESRGKKKKLPFRLILVPIALVIAVGFSLGRIGQVNEDNEMALERSYSAFDYNAVSKARSHTGERFLNLLETVPFGAGLSRTGAAAGKFAQENSEDTYFKYGFFTDNFWMAVLVDLGIPGLLILNSIIFLIIFGGFRNFRKFHSSKFNMMNAAILCSLCASVFGFYGAEGILYNPEAAFFWFFSGVLLKLPYLAEEG